VGLAITSLGEEVWTKIAIFPMPGWDGQIDHVHLHRVTHFDPEPTLSLEQLTAEHVRELRWWPLDTLLRSDATLCSATRGPLTDVRPSAIRDQTKDRGAASAAVGPSNCGPEGAEEADAAQIASGEEEGQMNDVAVQSAAWQRFWNRGGWWRALLAVVAYAVLYQLAGMVTGRLFAPVVVASDPLSTAPSVLGGIAAPILLMGLLVLGFVISLRWQQPVFGPQPVPGRWWMWIAVAILVIPIALRVAATDWAAYAPSVVIAIFALGLCIGFAEELLTRGVTVQLLRRSGYSERVVMVVSSALFALLHAGNVLSGQSVLVVAVTVVYTFGFGAMMYLAMRVTGRLTWAILLHAATDPTTMLATGGIDTHGAAGGAAGLLSIAGLFNWVYVIAALVAIVFVTGRALARTPDSPAEVH
jgi:Predicted metal-dependent membrane protease